MRGAFISQFHTQSRRHRYSIIEAMRPTSKKAGIANPSICSSHSHGSKVAHQVVICGHVCAYQCEISMSMSMPIYTTHYSFSNTRYTKHINAFKLSTNTQKAKPQTKQVMTHPTYFHHHSAHPPRRRLPAHLPNRTRHLLHCHYYRHH